MVFRQLTRKEKEEFAKNREAYQKYLLDDQGTIQILNKIFGASDYTALNTPERRALWRTGHELNGRSVLFVSKNSNTSLSWTALESGNVTENDAYYYTLGACMTKEVA